MTESAPQPSQEVADLLATMTDHRRLLLRTVQGITDDQARQRTTVSELTLGGIIKHLTAVETNWTNFIVEGPSAIGRMDAASMAARAASFSMQGEETLQALLDDYDAVARRTAELAASLPSLDASHPLPEAPWFKPGASWSARRTLLHLLAEMTQHAGHADIIREALDGQKTMG
jgi:uncharacterized damage-inducible protein DinB